MRCDAMQMSSGKWWWQVLLVAHWSYARYKCHRLLTEIAGIDVAMTCTLLAQDLFAANSPTKICSLLSALPKSMYTHA